jgi:hypothetical protein
MAKKIAAPVPTPAPKTAPKAAPKAEEKIPLSKMRGPRGVAEDAVITVLAETNPKREGTKAWKFWECYAEGQTVGEFCDACDADEDLKGGATPALVYDSKHGFIEIDGYEVPGGVLEAKPKKEPKPKEVKEPRGKPVARKVAKARADEEANEETV